LQPLVSTEGSSDLVMGSSDDASLAAASSSSSVSARPIPWSIIRWVLFGLYGVVFVRLSDTTGVPFDRERLIAWIVAALAIGCIGRPWRTAARLVADWVPFVLIFLAYDYSRGLADALGFSTHVTPQITAEKALFFGQVPSVWLQERMYQPGVIRWWDVPVSITYVTHFLAPVVVAGFLWARNRRQWKRYVSRLMTVSFIGVAIFCVFPAAPPWMASRDGIIDPVDRIAQQGWPKLGLHSAQRLIDKGQGTVNLVAAIPSLHAAYAALIAVFFWPLIRRRWLRPLLLIHPALMLFTIVYGGEHYAVDALVGYAVVAVACGGWTWWERGRAEPLTISSSAATPIDSGQDEDRNPDGGPVVDEVGILGG
jgi:hypothetical protein